MKRYKSIFKENKMKFHENWQDRLNVKDPQLKQFYIDALTKLKCNGPDEEWIVSTASLIDHCGMSDKDAIYFAKLNIYHILAGYNNEEKVNKTQEWSDSGIHLLTDLCNLENHFNDWSGEWLMDNVEAYAYYSSHWSDEPYEAEAVDSEYESEYREAWCDKVREEGCSIELNSQYCERMGEVSCGMESDGYVFEYDVKKLLKYVKLDYAGMDNLFKSLFH